MCVGVWHTLFSHSHFAHSHRHLHCHEHSTFNPKSINIDLRSVCFQSVLELFAQLLVIQLLVAFLTCLVSVDGLWQLRTLGRTRVQHMSGQRAGMLTTVALMSMRLTIPTQARTTVLYSRERICVANDPPSVGAEFNSS